jgi:hypothetical protein
MFRINKNLLALCIFTLYCMSIAHARRRSRVDDVPPIKKPLADAVKNNNFTVPQQQKQQQQTDDIVPLKLPVTTTTTTSLQSDLSESFDVGSSESNLSEESQDCENIDNISFELVTG